LIFVNDQVRGISHIQFAGAPSEPHWKNQFIYINAGSFETPVAIFVFEQAHSAIPRLRFQFGVQIATRRLRDKEASAFVEYSEHWKNNLWVARDFFDGEAPRDLVLRLKEWRAANSMYAETKEGDDDRTGTASHGPTVVAAPPPIKRRRGIESDWARLGATTAQTGVWS